MADFIRWLWDDPDLRRWFHPVILVCLVIGFFLAMPERRKAALLQAGLALQVLGYGAIVLGLRRKGHAFGRRTAAQVVRDIAARAPKISPPANFAHGSASLEVHASGTAEQRIPELDMSSTLPIDQRFRELAAHIKRLEGDVASVRAALAHESQSRSEQLATERTERVHEFQGLRDRLMELATGDIHVEFAGVLFATVGLVLAGIA